MLLSGAMRLGSVLGDADGICHLLESTSTGGGLRNRCQPSSTVANRATLQVVSRGCSFQKHQRIGPFITGLPAVE